MKSRKKTGIRKGFLSLSLKKLKKLDFSWLLRQALKYGAIRHAYRTRSAASRAGPIIAHLFCTNRCNSKCWMCDIPARKPAYEITTGDCLTIMDQLRELGVTGISFTGGEPLLRKDILALLRGSIDRGLSTMLVTNGLELGSVVNELCTLELSAVNISLDGSTEKIHDHNRGVEGAFRRSTENIRLLVGELKKRKSPTEVVISTVISANTMDDIGNIMGLCADMGVDRLILCPVHIFDNPEAPSLVAPLECGYDISSFILDHEQRSIVDNSDAYISGLPAVLGGVLPPAGCSAAYTTIFLDYEMNVYPCKAYLELKKPIATMKHGASLREIWNSEAYASFRRESKACTRCYMTVNREFDGLFR
jgi:MoaA/NifB/PqqE/SkfB family radical SAM enzyme